MNFGHLQSVPYSPALGVQTTRLIFGSIHSKRSAPSEPRLPRAPTIVRKKGSQHFRKGLTNGKGSRENQMWAV